jgi:hypothetical protein
MKYLKINRGTGRKRGIDIWAPFPRRTQAGSVVYMALLQFQDGLSLKSLSQNNKLVGCAFLPQKKKNLFSNQCLLFLFNFLHDV